MFHTALSVMEHSGCPSGNVWWLPRPDRDDLLNPPLPGIGWSGIHPIGGRPTTITYLQGRGRQNAA